MARSFTGEPRDATGLTYLRTRYYDPDLGRFLTRDMWPGVPAIPQTQNRFSYVSNNPTTHADPSGRFLDTILDVAFMIYDVASLIFGPEKERQGNWLALGADVVGALIPFVTGGGAVIRAGAHVADHVDDVIGGGHALDNLARQAGCSFAAETLVATPDGPVAISSVEIGDIVLAWDESAQSVVERRVTAVLPHLDDEIARVAIDGVVVTTTTDHPFYTLETGWVQAGTLWPGAHVQSTAGSGLVSNVEIDPLAGVMWNLTVDGAHTFLSASVDGSSITAVQLSRVAKVSINRVTRTTSLAAANSLIPTRNHFSIARLAMDNRSLGFPGNLDIESASTSGRSLETTWRTASQPQPQLA